MRAHNTNKTSINDACLGHVTWRKRSGGCISRIFRFEEKLFIYVQIKQSIFECKFGNLQHKLFFRTSQHQQWLGWTWNKLDPCSYMIWWHIYVYGPLNNLWPWFACTLHNTFVLSFGIYLPRIILKTRFFKSSWKFSHLGTFFNTSQQLMKVKL